MYTNPEKIKYGRTILLAVILFLICSCNKPPLQSRSIPPADPAVKKWIIDTDVAIDDWPAILYMVNHPQVEVIGITVTGCGETNCEPGVQNAMDLCLLAEKGDIPVAAASEEPLDGYHIFPTPWRTMANTLSGIPLPRNTKEKVNENALELMSRLLRSSSEKISILAVGPLTNISEVFEKEPDLIDKVEKLVIMGGALQAKGNIIVPGFTDHIKNQVAEWNIYIDPLAAQKVFRSRLPKVLIPLDATNKVQVTFDFVKSFKQKSESPEAKFLCKIFDKETEFIKSGEFYFWDPLAAALGVEDQLGKFDNQKIDVVVEYCDFPCLHKESQTFSQRLPNGKLRRNFDYYQSGRTIVASTGGLTKACIDVDGEKFKERYITVINKKLRNTGELTKP